MHDELVLFLFEPLAHFLQPSLETLEETLRLRLEDNIASHFLDFDRVLEK